MRRIITIIIQLFFILCPIYTQTPNTESIIGSVNNAIKKESFKKAWRYIHVNRSFFSQSNQLLDYNISLSDIYKGTYQYLDDDTLKNENIEVLEYIADEFLNGKQDEIEKKYGSMWERLYWLSRIYHSTNNMKFRHFTEKCRDVYKNSKYKNDQYYLSLIYTYINYAIRNNEDWSYVLFYTPVSEIESMESHSDLTLAVALHQKGIAHLRKEISNREYQSRNSSIDWGFELDSNPLLDMGKGYLDAAHDTYKKCNPAETKLLMKQLMSDYKLYDWLIKNPDKTNINDSDSFSIPVCLYDLLPMECYKPIGIQLNKIQEENYNAFKLSTEYLADRNYKDAALCLTEIAPSLIVPQDIILCYFNMISSFAMYDSEKANTYLTQYYNTVKEFIIPFIFKKSTEYERQRMWKSITLTLEQLSMKTALMFPESQSTTTAYDIFQTIKNFETETTDYIRYVSNNGEFDEFTQNSIQYYNQKRDSLYYGNPKGKYFAGNLEQLELNKMLLNDKIRTNEILNGIYSYKTISRRLNHKASLIEYCVYIDIEGSQRYAAFIINTEDKNPTLIDICSVNEASELLSKDSTAINNTYSNNHLYSTFFRKLEPFLHHDTIIVCPVGVLEAVNFDAIYHDGKRLMDKYTFYRAYSGHSFFKAIRTRHNGGNQATLYGGIAYSKEQIKESEYADRHFRLSRGERSTRGSLQYLQYSSEEVANIRNIIEKKDIKTNILSGLKATESSFIELDGKAPTILHIATHGFFISENEDLETHSFFNNLELYQDYKLLRAGLFLANSNETWNGNLPPTSSNDGILTAYEISKMDLSNVSLAVLSACETANGFVDNIEGTQGLQYAFRQAGAGSMLLSLWKIDDAVTFLFMDEFYSTLFTQNDMLKAYQSALKKIMEEYPEPYYWAGFILIYN